MGGQGLKSHWVLPVVMHHFGCVVPSYESLSIIKTLAVEGVKKNGDSTADGNDNIGPENGNGNGATNGKKESKKKAKKEKPPPLKILDVGSGSGYWSFMLGQCGLETVAVDNMQSEWYVAPYPSIHLPPTKNTFPSLISDTLTALIRRVTWLKDTHLTTGTSYLHSLPDSQHKSHILLLVYPITGPDGSGSFTKDLMKEYQGDVVVVAGTQNKNGYTSFGRGKGTMDSFMLESQEQRGKWEKVVQVPLPSFAGRDEGLFVYIRKR